MKQELERICSKYTKNFGIDVRKDLNEYEIKLGEEGMKYAKQIANDINSSLGAQIAKIKVDYNGLNDIKCWIDVYPKGKVMDSKVKDGKVSLEERLFIDKIDDRLHYNDADSHEGYLYGSETRKIQEIIKKYKLSEQEFKQLAPHIYNAYGYKYLLSLRDSKMKDETIQTPRGTFIVVNKSKEQLNEEGYGFYWSYKGYSIYTNSETHKACAIKDSKTKDANLGKSKLKVGQIVHLDPSRNSSVDKELLSDKYRVDGFWYNSQLVKEDVHPENIMDFGGIAITNLRTNKKYNVNRFQLMDSKVKDYKPELLAELKKIAMEGEKIKENVDKAYKAYYNVGNYYSWDKLKKEEPKKAEMIIRVKEQQEKKVEELAKKWDRIIEEMNRGETTFGNFKTLYHPPGSLLPTMDEYMLVEKRIRNLEKSYGKTPYGDSLNSYMFTHKDTGKRYVVKAKNTQDAITKFYKAKTKDSKVKDSQYIYLVDPKSQNDEIEKAKSLGMGIRKFGGLIEISGTGKQFAKLTGFNEAQLEEFSHRMMSAIRKVSDSKKSPSDK